MLDAEEGKRQSRMNVHNSASMMILLVSEKKIGVKAARYLLKIDVSEFLRGIEFQEGKNPPSLLGIQVE
jgi:hypothetical protein